MTPDLRDQPCARDCPRRSSTCHATCESYQRFAEARKEVYAKRRQEADLNSAEIQMHMRWTDRRKKGRKRK